ncbi:ABC transporter permease [Polaromonas sp.]|uniref:ABC transporter permease n=1 Tax=Polaromonas sp. TaxID=1869339 RepID=UPI0032670796
MSIAQPLTLASGPPMADDDARRLQEKIRWDRRIRQLKCLPFVLPLLVFLVGSFLLPIGLLLTRSIDNRDIADALSATAGALARWDGQALPVDAAFDALARDLAANTPERVATLARNLNHRQAGARSAVMQAARVARSQPNDYKAALIEANAQWGEVGTWQVIHSALPRYTDFYLLASLDLRRDHTGGIGSVPDEGAVYRDVLWRTFYISLLTMLICLALGYPLAYLMASARGTLAKVLFVLVILPFWTSLLVRTTAWLVLLQGGGLVNTMLAWLGWIDPQHPLALVHNRTGVLIAMVHILLPFMVLPLYSVMRAIPPNYMRAASSLGAAPHRAFLKVYLPLTYPGLSAGCLLVFILALGYYITPALVGGVRDQMVSYYIDYFTSQATNWGMAAALSVVLLTFVLILYVVYSRFVGLDKLRMG